MTTTTRLRVTDNHGMEGLNITVAATPAAEAAAVAFLRRTCTYSLGQMDYRVWSLEDIADDIGADFMEYLSPTCEHGLSLDLCAGPDHYPSAEMERSWEV